MEYDKSMRLDWPVIGVWKKKQLKLSCQAHVDLSSSAYWQGPGISTRPIKGLSRSTWDRPRAKASDRGKLFAKFKLVPTSVVQYFEGIHYS